MTKIRPKYKEQEDGDLYKRMEYHPGYFSYRAYWFMTHWEYQWNKTL